MSFKTFKNVFRNLIKLDSLRVSKNNAALINRSHTSAYVPSCHVVALNRPRPSSIGFFSANVVIKTLSRFFTATANSCAGRVTKSSGTYLSNCRRFSTLPMFGAFGIAYLASPEEPPGKADIAKLFLNMQMNMCNNQKSAPAYQQFKSKVSAKLEDYELKERLGEPSSCAAIYSAVYNKQEFAVKIMFNYEFASNSYSLQKGFYKECRVVAQRKKKNIQGNEEIDVLPEHPNVIQILDAFDEETPCPQDALSSYPHALPSRLSSNGFGRNRTLCLVMPKYDCTLKEYVRTRLPSKRQSTLLLAQLLEGVAHLVDHNEAHRDLKSDNVLLDLSDSTCPRLVITDFGCCIADRTLGMKLPFESPYVDRGGNSAMMAPEIASRKPGPGEVLDYSKSDVWACGAMACEIFGCRNPFTTGQLDNRYYQDEDLPKLSGLDPLIKKVVRLLLMKDPNRRPSASDAATMLLLILYAPKPWLIPGCFSRLTDEDVITWLLTMGLAILREEQKMAGQNLPLSAEVSLQKCFLRRASCQMVFSALAYLHDI